MTAFPKERGLTGPRRARRKNFPSGKPDRLLTASTPCRRPALPGGLPPAAGEPFFFGTVNPGSSGEASFNKIPNVETPRGASPGRRNPPENNDVPRGLSSVQTVPSDPETPHGASPHWEALRSTATYVQEVGEIARPPATAMD